MDKILELIHELGIKRTYVGYHQLATAVELVIEDENRLLYVHKWLYTDVAKIHNTTPACVERNIRTVNLICWNKGNRELLEQIAGHPLDERPGNGDFIDILAAYIKNLSLEKNILN
ncbi:MAG: sporulation initiation factor Spo0A C-terminal domain-containing protein [Lachnospiraceae bacterium]|nr:sporulation initiation factor Spo0A C-terminal domain-containing protein [Lachnospiraceae bacterium]